jgi:hypothetical protein
MIDPMMPIVVAVINSRQRIIDPTMPIVVLLFAKYGTLLLIKLPAFFQQ